MIEYTSLEQAIARGNFVIRPIGVSMWPMIRNGKDSILVQPVKGRLKKYDLPVYKDNIGRYVVHRIIEVTDTGYVICGDGLYEREYDITDKNMLGIVEGFFRKEKYIPCTSKGYMLYVKFWVGIIFLRKPIIWTVRKFRRAGALLKDYFLRIVKGKGHYQKEKEEKAKSEQNQSEL